MARPLITANISGCIGMGFATRGVGNVSECASGCFSCRISCTDLPPITWSRGSILACFSSVIKRAAASTLPFLVSSAKSLALVVECWGAFNLNGPSPRRAVSGKDLPNGSPRFLYEHYHLLLPILIGPRKYPSPNGTVDSLLALDAVMAAQW